MKHLVNFRKSLNLAFSLTLLLFISACTPSEPPVTYTYRLVAVNGTDKPMYVYLGDEFKTIPINGGDSITMTTSPEDIPSHMETRMVSGDDTVSVEKPEFPKKEIRDGSTVVYKIKNKGDWALVDCTGLYARSMAEMKPPSALGPLSKKLKFKELDDKKISVKDHTILGPDEPLVNLKDEKFIRVMDMPKSDSSDSPKMHFIRRIYKK